MSTGENIRWRFIGVELLSDAVFVLCGLICLGGLLLILNADSVDIPASDSLGTFRAGAIAAIGGMVMFFSLFGMLFASGVRVLVEIDRDLALANQRDQAPPHSGTAQTPADVARTPASATRSVLPYLIGTGLRTAAMRSLEIYRGSTLRQRLVAGGAIGIVVVALLLVHVWPWWASIPILTGDCSIVSPVAELICGDSTLSHDDQVVNSLYASRLKASFPALRADVEAAQAAWIKERDACVNDPNPTQCLMNEYSARMTNLAEGT